jgi:type II secretory pathway component PulK
MIRHPQPSPHHHPRRGAALLFALLSLGIFALLGTAYLANMSLATDNANLAVRQARAREIAAGGIRAAIAHLEKAIQADQVRMVLNQSTFDFPTYEAKWDGESLALQKLEDRLARATVTITDESGKLNLNHAPAAALEVLLQIDGNSAREIIASRPPNNPNGQWLLHPQDLVARGLLSPDEFARLDTSLLTTYTVLDHANPTGWLNINAAPAEVMGAVLGLSRTAAEHALVKRPFKSLAALAEAADRDPASFNIPPESPDTLPRAFTLQSRCFRITSEARYAVLTHGQELYRTTAYAEAVVIFDNDMKIHIVHWAAQPPDNPT